MAGAAAIEGRPAVAGPSFVVVMGTTAEAITLGEPWKEVAFGTCKDWPGALAGLGGTYRMAWGQASAAGRPSGLPWGLRTSSIAGTCARPSAAGKTCLPSAVGRCSFLR